VQAVFVCKRRLQQHKSPFVS